MDKAFGQADRPTAQAGRRSSSSEATRQRLLTAAAELIAEVGWGRVTTRAVADRAGLPHGAVSYHFRGKQELLGEAAMGAFADAIPAGEFASMSTLADFMGLVRTEIGTHEAIDPVLSRLMLETLREAERDPWLRDRMGEMLQAYRMLMVDLVRREQDRGRVSHDVSAEGLAILLGAAGDGLLMHALLDPELDMAAALDALETLVVRSA